MTRSFVGIAREPVFSPGRVEDDAAILREVATNLRGRGARVEVCQADDDRWPEIDGETMVFTMAQGDTALERLRNLQRRGVLVINSVEGILNCQRHRTVPLLTAAHLAFPESVLVDCTAADPLPAWIDPAGAWVKRGDVHATDDGDVSFVADAGAARTVLRRFAGRGIARAVVQRHAPGTVVKFYAVRGRFFHAVPPEGAALAADTLAAIDRLGQQAAQVLDVAIYGGDCVVGDDGELRLIDLNDWPSYRRCRLAAATEIAAYVEAQEATST